MADNIVLSSAVRNNLLSLQKTASLLGKTQERLATGLKVNSALDDPTAFFTASSLNSRAGDLNRLLDSVGLAVQTVEAADQGISAITKLVENAQATARQALQSPPVSIAAEVEGTGAALDADVNEVHVGTGTFDTSGGAGSFTVNGETINFALNATIGDVTTAINDAMDAAGIDITATNDGTDITLTAGNPDIDITLAGADLADVGLDTTTETAGVNLLTQAAVTQGQTLTVTVGGGTAQTITFGTGANEVSSLAELQDALEGLTGVTATVDVDGNISVTAEQDDESITIGGTATLGNFGLAAGTTNPTAGVNANRAALETQFNALRTQIDQLAADATFNGVNLLAGDDLSVIFNEDGSSSLSIDGVSFNSAGLGIGAVTTGDFQSNAGIESAMDELSTAISTLRSQASTFGSNLSVVQVRQEFTKNIINTLQTGAANLTLADTNEEGANLLALQTRQQLSSVALSMASQADQN
ncbi:MAG: flagellin, partial [Hyphomicrobiales bacterium]